MISKEGEGYKMENGLSTPEKKKSSASNESEESGGDLDRLKSVIESTEYSNGEKLNHIMSDTAVRKKLLEKLRKDNGIDITKPILRLDIESDDNDCELDQSDICEVFSRYGQVTEVLIKSQSLAYVSYTDPISALFAQTTLNGHVINDTANQISIRLLVQWCSPSDIESQINTSPSTSSNNLPSGTAVFQTNNQSISSQGTPIKTKSPSVHEIRSYPNSGTKHNDLSNGNGSKVSNQEENMKIYPGLTHSFSTSAYGGSGSNMYSPEKDDPGTGYQMKFTCRYEIQIENDRDFQVARKIIGSKGSHMKRIIEASITESNVDKNSEPLKLRLRGKGSGYKEGPDQMESNDPLHLCVSARVQNTYQIACRQVEELLQKIYEEYRQWSLKMRNYEINLMVKKFEAPGKTNTGPHVGFNNPMLIMHPQYGQKEFPGLYAPPYKWYPMMMPGGGGMMNPVAVGGLMPMGGPNGNHDINNDHRVGPNHNGVLNSQNGNVGGQVGHGGGPGGVVGGEFEISDNEIRKLIEDRNKARRESKFEEADRIRNYLKLRGIALMDEKGGRGKGHEVTTWKHCKLGNYANGGLDVGKK